MQIAAIRRELKANGKQSFAHLKRNSAIEPVMGKPQERGKEIKHRHPSVVTGSARTHSTNRNKTINSNFLHTKKFPVDFFVAVVVGSSHMHNIPIAIAFNWLDWEISVCCVHEIWLRVPHVFVRKLIIGRDTANGRKNLFWFSYFPARSSSPTYKNSARVRRWTADPHPTFHRAEARAT